MQNWNEAAPHYQAAGSATALMGLIGLCAGTVATLIFPLDLGFISGQAMILISLTTLALGGYLWFQGARV